LRQWDRNPKPHDIGALIRSFKRYGFQDPPAFDATLNGGHGGIKEGNGRYEALTRMQSDGESPPDHIHASGDDWEVPVLFGGDATSQAEAEAYALDHNALTVLGGDFGPKWVSDLFSEEPLKDILTSLPEMPVSIDGDDLDAMLSPFVPDEKPANTNEPQTCPQCGYVMGGE
jgi:hypothetical protein